MASSQSGGIASGTIIYMSRYGDVPEAKSVVVGSNVTWQDDYLPVITFPGGTHVGWYTTETFEEDTKVEVGDVLTESVTVYAKWKSNMAIIDALALYDLADAIREKYLGSTTYLLSEMASAIESL